MGDDGRVGWAALLIGLVAGAGTLVYAGVTSDDFSERRADVAQDPSPTAHETLTEAPFETLTEEELDEMLRELSETPTPPPSPTPSPTEFRTGLENWDPPFTPPVERVPASTSCHDAYRPCVPVGQDHDCYGGSGQPPWVYTRVYLDDPAYDPYQLDELGVGDGVGCESLPEP